MGLGQRFGGSKKVNGSEPSAAVVSQMQGQGQAGKLAASPAPTSKPTAAPATPSPSKSGGLGGRFAKKIGDAPAKTGTVRAKAPDEVIPKLEQKATSNGSASTAMTGSVVTGTLVDRLQGLAKDGNAVTSAAASAVTHRVGEAMNGDGVAEDKIATGINPPDSSREWTDEEQAAEAARLAGSNGTTTTAPATTGRGKKGGAKATTVTQKSDGSMVTTTGVSGGVPLAMALMEVDAIVARLMSGGYRQQAGILLEASGRMAAIA